MARLQNVAGNWKIFEMKSVKNSKRLKPEISAIPSTDIQGLRTAKQNYVSQRDRFNRDHARYETHLDSLRKEREKLNSKRDNLLRVKEKDVRVLAELESNTRYTADTRKILRQDI